MRDAPTLLAIFAVLLAPLAPAGEIYRYEEEDGTIVYTNVRPSGRTSRKARRMSGEFRTAPAKAAPAAPVGEQSLQALADLEAAIDRAALRYRIPPNLVRAVMHAESNFDPHAVSPKGACGLMQLMPRTAREMYVSDIFDAQQNIEGGTRYLRYLANEFEGDMVKMVAAYNAGPEAVKRSEGRVPPFAETQAYVRKVIDLYFQYKAQSMSRSAPPSQ